MATKYVYPVRNKNVSKRGRISNGVYFFGGGIQLLISLFLVVNVCYGQNVEQFKINYSQELEGYYNKGIEYAFEGKLVEAKEEFSKALKIDPFYKFAKVGLLTTEEAIAKKIQEDTAISILKGLDYGKKGIVAEAIAGYDRAITNNPLYAATYVYRGDAYALYKGMYEQALTDYNKAIEINPNSADAFNSRSFFYSAKGKFEEAFSDLNKAIEIDPNYIDAYLNRGIVFVNKKQFDQAISDFNKLLEINPKDIRAYINRAVVNKERGLYEEVISDCDKVLKIDPTQVKVYITKALMCEDTGRIADAIAAYRGVIQYALKETDALLAKARIKELEQQELLKKADSDTLKKENEKKALYDMAGKYFARGDIDKATESCQNILKIDPNYDKAFYGLGVAYTAKGDINKAIEHFQKAIDLNPKSGESYSGLGTIFLNKNDFEKAIPYLKKAIEIDPLRIEVYFNLGVIYYQKQDYLQAIQYLKKAVEFNPNDREALMFLKDAQEKSKADSEKVR